MSGFELLGLADEARWKQYLQELPIEQQDVYYTPEYYRLFENLGDGIAKCFVYKEGNNHALYPFLINSVNAFGYDIGQEYCDIQGAYGYNGVISSSNDGEFIDCFYKCFNSYCIENSIIAEFTRFNPLLENHKFFQKQLTNTLDRETVALDLVQSYDVIWDNEYSSINRNMIRKARKLGYTSNALSVFSTAAIDQFISIYHYNMEIVGAEEYFFFNKAFFYNTFNWLKKYVYLIILKDNEGEAVCASIFFRYGVFFHYHLSGRTAKADNSVNNFLLNEAVKLAQSKGAKTFHFGGGRSNFPDDSLLKFKNNFSKTRLSFFIGKKIHNQEIYDEVVRQWQDLYPDKIDKYKNHLLKYHYQ